MVVVIEGKRMGGTNEELGAFGTFLSLRSLSLRCYFIIDVRWIPPSLFFFIYFILQQEPHRF